MFRACYLSIKIQLEMLCNHRVAGLQAWDTLTWFAALIAMASFLNKFGFIKWFSDQVVTVVGSLGLQWQASFAVITLLYFYSHYLFASGAAHIGAMYTAFLSVSVVSTHSLCS